MSHIDEVLLTDAVRRLFAERCPPAVVEGAEEGWPAVLWDAVEAADLPLAGAPEDAGGAGGGLRAAFVVAREAGRHAVPLPLGETALLAGHALAHAGAAAMPGPLAAVWGAVEARPDGRGWVLDGIAPAVPWGRVARLVVVAQVPAGTLVGTLKPTEDRVVRGNALSGEPRDDVDLRGARLEDATVTDGGLAPEHLDARGALLRASQICGALEAVQELTITHARDRRQFGRAIGRFQMVQSRLAELAGDVAAACAITAAAQHALVVRGDEDARLAIALAKARASRAAGVVAEHAHQIHGAIGFTRELPLHQLTRRLWTWRDEHGDETAWSAVVGRAALSAGPGGVWAGLIDAS